jgi:TonB family protein
VAYLAAAIWGLRPPSPGYVLPEPNVVEVSDTGVPEVLHSPAPVYPEEAIRQRVEGTVRLRAIIDEDGRVSSVTPLGGPKLLTAAAVEAVRGWQFTAVPAEIETEVPFLLWHPGPRKVEPAQPLIRAHAFAGRGRHGTVRVVATVRADGTVESARAVSGTRRLMTAAEANVRRWTFRAERHDGEPQRATTVVEVAF